MRATLALVAYVMAGAASAQVASFNPRFQTIDYIPDQVVLIRGAPGYAITLQLAPDDRIESVALGDSGAWQVTADKTGNRLFVKALQAGAATNMTVITSARLYAFDLQPMANPSMDMPYSVQFRYPARARIGDVATKPMTGMYRMHGSKSLWPDQMSDDGTHTYIQWDTDTPIPAIYTRDRQGREALINGMMRDDIFVIDSVSPKFVFRIDQQVAVATRRAAKGAE